MLIKLGTISEEVKFIQYTLNLTVDGVFGVKTERAVRDYQMENQLIVDGIVGDSTWGLMKSLSTDASELTYTTDSGLIINKYYLPKGEYVEGPTKKEYAFMHHTAGWNNPYNQVDSWGRDKRGRVGTEFIVGGESIRGNDEFDGVTLQSIPTGGYGWHLGKNGSQHMHDHSTSIELCNFGWIKDGLTYTGARVDKDQIVTLEKEFRGYKQFHKYSDAQIESLRKWILFIAERDNIDVHKGLIQWIKEEGPYKAFEFHKDAYYGKIKGLLTHTNTNKKWKWDLNPQPLLIEMLLSI